MRLVIWACWATEDWSWLKEWHWCVNNNAQSGNESSNFPPKSSHAQKKATTWQSFDPPLLGDPGIHSRCHYYPPVWCRDLGSLLATDQATWGFSPMPLALYPWHQITRPCVKWTSPQGNQPTKTTLFQVQLRWAGYTARRTNACPKQSLLSSKKECLIIMLLENVTKTGWRDSSHRQESTISHGSRRLQTKTVGADQWKRPEPEIESLRQRSIKLQMKRRRRQKEKATSQPSAALRNLCLSKVQKGLHTKKWILQPQTADPQHSPCLRGIGHDTAWRFICRQILLHYKQIADIFFAKKTNECTKRIVYVAKRHSNKTIIFSAKKGEKKVDHTRKTNVFAKKWS